MKISEQWLREWINPPEKLEALCARLTSAGLEVGSLGDGVFEIELTPNRGDCASVLGVARECAALYEMPVASLDFPKITATDQKQQAVRIEEAGVCPYYVGQVVTGLDLSKATPLFIQERLKACGLSCVNSVVDVLNYVMLEMGQPMHAFDLDKINGELTVRFSKERETDSLILLDQEEIALKPKTLIIADNSGPLAIAGILGGHSSAVSTSTKNVFIESAYFMPKSLAGKARQYGLQTQASYRFERGVDPNGVLASLDRACAILQEHFGVSFGARTEIGSLSSPYIKEIAFEPNIVNKILGINLSIIEIKQLLERLKFKITEGDVWQVSVPSYRHDIAIAVDLVEECARLMGLENIEAQLPKMALKLSSNPLLQRKRQLKRLCVANGLQELINYSFVDPKRQSLLSKQEGIALLNPIAENRAVMRTTLWTGLLEILAYHQARQQHRLRFFEIGTCFNQLSENTVNEQEMIAGLLSSSALTENWRHSKRTVDFFDIKALVEELLLGMGHPKGSISFKAIQVNSLHPALSAEIYLGTECLGLVGALHPGLLEQFELLGPVFLFELALGPILAPVLPVFAPITKFPQVRRDLAFLVPNNLNVGDILNRVRTLAGEQLVDLCLFDVYEGKGVPAGHRSIAMGLILQDPLRTLVETEVDVIISRVLLNLEQNFGLKLRS
jgi:phenylalanyl-tRNA synthetase beta chain